MKYLRKVLLVIGLSLGMFIQTTSINAQEIQDSKPLNYVIVDEENIYEDNSFEDGPFEKIVNEVDELKQNVNESVHQFLEDISFYLKKKMMILAALCVAVFYFVLKNIKNIALMGLIIALIVGLIIV